MSPAFKVRASYALMLLFVAALSAEMAVFLFRYPGGLSRRECLPPVLAFGALLVYAVVKVLWGVIRQWRLTRRGLLLFEAHMDVEWTERLRGRYREWGTDILAVRDDAFIALAIGLLRPRIMVSSGVLERFTEEEVEAILLHERHHCRSRDNLKQFVSGLLEEAFGYLPIIRPVAAYAATWRELFADRYAIRQMRTSVHLGSVLLKLAQEGTVRQRGAAYFAETALDYRMLQIIEPEQAVKVPLQLWRPLWVTCCFMLLIMMGGSS